MNQVARIGGKTFYSLSHFAGPEIFLNLVGGVCYTGSTHSVCQSNGVTVSVIFYARIKGIRYNLEEKLPIRMEQPAIEYCKGASQS